MVSFPHLVKEEKTVGVEERDYEIHVRGRGCCINLKWPIYIYLGPHQWPISVACGARGYRPRRAGWDRSRGGKWGRRARGTVNGYRDGRWEVLGDRREAHAAARRALRVVFVTAPSLMSLSHFLV